MHIMPTSDPFIESLRINGCGKKAYKYTRESHEYWTDPFKVHFITHAISIRESEN